MYAMWRTALSLALVSAFAAVPAQAQSPADFYKGKQVTLIVGYGPGGGYDIYARLLSRHMGKHIPGNPNLVIQNMPGAGSLVSANFLYQLAPKDGTAFGIFARNIPLIGMIGTQQQVKYDPLKFTWIGSASSGANDAYLLVGLKTAKVKAIEDARRDGGPELLIGSTAEGASSDAMATFFRDILGVRLKVIGGYRDGNELYLAMERGEIEGRMVGFSSGRGARAHWFGRPDSPINVLAQMGRKTRHPDLADVPTIRELARSDRDRQLIEVLELPYALTRPYAAPPGVPADRAKALQDAFVAAHNDPELAAEAMKLKMDISPVSGPEVLKLIEGIKAVPPETLKSVEKLISEN
jgi:tripartite-type tricarboxylate transporter receptor subunit TctC